MASVHFLNKEKKVKLQRHITFVRYPIALITSLSSMLKINFVEFKTFLESMCGEEGRGGGGGELGLFLCAKFMLILHTCNGESPTLNNIGRL